MELDFKAVKALSSSTRVKILNQILQKEATPTQLSDDLGKSKSTISSHLTKLHSAQLVEKDKEKGRKRVVYAPTRKAEAIVKGKERRVKFTLASSALSLAVGLTLVSSQLVQGMFGLKASRTTDQSVGTMGTMDTMSQEATRTATNDAGSFLSLSADIFFLVGIGFLGISILGFLYGVTVRKLSEDTE